MFSTLSVNAIDAPTNLKLIGSGTDFVKIGWDPAEWALWYYMYYGTKSWVWGSYESELYEIIEWNEIQINELSAWTTYYFSVTSIDEYWDEAGFSNEWVFSTKASEGWINSSESTSGKFEFLSVVPKSPYSLELSFSSELDNSNTAVRDFRITEKLNTWNEIQVLSSELDIQNPKKVILTLSEPTLPQLEYIITVIRVADKNGKTIESWIDSIGSFVWADLESENSILNEDEKDEKDWEMLDDNSWSMELNSADLWWVSWAELDKDDVIKDTLSAANSNQKLPTTWPEHILIFILASILWTLIFIFKFKKRS